MTDTQNIFHWLDSVRLRRSMYVRNITELEVMVHGYYAALDLHNLLECGPQMTQGHFGVWLREVTDWSLSAGWAYAIKKNTKSSDVFDRFFSFVDQYRELKPTVTARVTLKPQHQPTGKRRVIGHSGRMERPDEILAVNYAPTSLNHLRYRYIDRYLDDRFLGLGNGSYNTEQSDLFDWASDEFGIAHTEWEIIPDHNNTMYPSDKSGAT